MKSSHQNLESFEPVGYIYKFKILIAWWIFLEIYIDNAKEPVLLGKITYILVDWSHFFYQNFLQKFGVRPIYSKYL